MAEKVFGSIDLFRHIVGRLPTKTLFRLKCVSKHWLSLISDKEFRHMHTFHGGHHDQQPPSLIISTHKQENILLPLTTRAMTLPAHTLDLSFLNHGAIRVVRSCNGVLLCRDGHGHHYFVCNPITKEFVSLPPNRYGYPSCAYLAFEPSRSPNFHVVFTMHIVVRYPVSVCGCMVYSSETGSWSKFTEFPLTDEFPTLKRFNSDDGVYCNGGIHWCGGSLEFHMFLHIETLSIKLMENTFPNYYRTAVPQKVRYFGESGGRLHLALDQTVDSRLVFYVFEMKPDFSLWLFRHRVDFNFPPPQSWELLMNYRSNNYSNNPIPICFGPNQEGNPGNMLVLFRDGTGILLYDPVNFELRKLSYHPEHINMWFSRDYNFCRDIFKYTESLAPVEAKMRHT